MVTVVGPWLLWSDHGYCGRTMVTVVGPWLLWSDHGYCGRTMVTVVGSWLLWSDQGYCCRIMVTMEVQDYFGRIMVAVFVCLIFYSLRPINNLSVIKEGSAWVLPVLS